MAATFISNRNLADHAQSSNYVIDSTGMEWHEITFTDSDTQEITKIYLDGAGNEGNPTMPIAGPAQGTPSSQPTQTVANDETAAGQVDPGAVNYSIINVGPNPLRIGAQLYAPGDGLSDAEDFAGEILGGKTYDPTEFGTTARVTVKRRV